MKETNYITVGLYKGEMDFGVNLAIEELSYEKMRELRQMICVAIGQAEQMWRRRKDLEPPFAGSMSVGESTNQ